MRKVRRWRVGFGWVFIKRGKMGPKPTPGGMTREEFLFARGSYILDRREQGYTLSEIADRVGCSRENVRTECERQRRRIKNLATRVIGLLEHLQPKE